MKLDIGAVLRDAWAMAKRDRDVLIGVAGVFVLVPQVAQAMFLQDPPALPPSGADPVALQAWLDVSTLWWKHNMVLLLGLVVTSLFGTLALFTLYAGRDRPTVATAMQQAIGLLPRFVLLALLVTFPVNAGTLLLLVPGLYLKGRLMPISPAFVAEQPLGVIAAWRRSFALTRGNALLLMALACVPLLGGMLLAIPFRAIAQTMSGAPMANPVVAAVLDLCIGGVYTIAAVAAILIEIVVYRRLSSGI